MTESEIHAVAAALRRAIIDGADPVFPERDVVADILAGRDLEEDIDARFARLLDPRRAPAGQAWTAALTDLADHAARQAGTEAERSGPSRPPVDIASVEQDAASTLDELRAEFPAMRALAIPQHRLVEAICDADHPLRAEAGALMNEAGFDADRCARELRALFAADAMTLQPCFLARGREFDREALRSRDSAASWHTVHLASGFEPGSNTDFDLSALYAKDPAAAVAWTNDHEFAHLASRHIRDADGENPYRDEYLEENVADGAATMRAVQRWGLERATELVATVLGMRHAHLVERCDAGHWTDAALREALSDAAVLEAEGRLAGMSFADLVRHADVKVRGPIGDAPLEGGRWAVLAEEDWRELARVAERFHNSQLHREDHGPAARAFARALSGLAAHRCLNAIELPVKNDARAADTRFAAAAIAPIRRIAGAIAELRMAAFCGRSEAGLAETAAGAAADALGGLRDLVLLDARLRADCGRPAGKASIAALSGMISAIQDVRQEKSLDRLTKALTRLPASVARALHALPPRLSGLADTGAALGDATERIVATIENAFASWRDGLSSNPLGPEWGEKTLRASRMARVSRTR